MNLRVSSCATPVPRAGARASRVRRHGVLHGRVAGLVKTLRRMHDHEARTSDALEASRYLSFSTIISVLARRKQAACVLYVKNRIKK